MNGLKWLRLALLCAGGYLALGVVVYLVSFAMVLVGRVADGDPRDGVEGVDGIANLRKVDDTVWAGAQPDDNEVYRTLADRGVSVVVDLRTGARDDEREDDPELLAELGIRYRRLPVKDGHSPTRQVVRAFVEEVEAVATADGILFVHCGAGIGRTTSLQAAYVAAKGREPEFWRHVAVGPLTLEQLWFVGSAGPDDPGHSNPVVRRVSEFVDGPRRLFSRARALF